jgi:hypothetical protein
MFNESWVQVKLEGIHSPPQEGLQGRSTGVGGSMMVESPPLPCTEAFSSSGSCLPGRSTGYPVEFAGCCLLE